MSMVELLAGYDPVDLEYKERFHDSGECYVFTGREMKAGYMSFIPKREEAEKILLGPLRRLQTEQ